MPVIFLICPTLITLVYFSQGTGWSSDAVVNQPYITSLVLAAMKEPGPFIMIGSMDSGDVRAYQYALDNPANVVAVVPVVMSGVSEFTTLGRFKGWTDNQVISYAKSTLYSRLTIGNVINFFGVSWGLIAAFAPPSAGYVPQSKAYESIFLNIYNERQWITNCNYLYEGYLNPGSDFVGESIWITNPNLSQDIPVIAFDQFLSPADISKLCASGSSEDCQLQSFTYNLTISTYHTVMARNPKNRLNLCTTCNATLGNSFVVDQEGNIPWFADTLMKQVGDIKI
jgi:hypothetical protein